MENEELSTNLSRNIESVKKRIENLEDPSELEVLDIEIISDIDHNIRNIVLVMIDGGPYVELMLGSGRINGYWGKAEEHVYIDSKNIDMLWSHYSKLWNGGEKE